jgi:hypothetical protein
LVSAAPTAATAAMEPNTAAKGSANPATAPRLLFRARCIPRMGVADPKLVERFVVIRSLDLAVVFMGIVEEMRDTVGLVSVVSIFLKRRR